MPLHRHLLYCSLLLGLAGCSMFNWNKGEQTAEEQAVVSSIATEPVEQAPSELQLVWGVDVDQRRPLSPYSFAQPVQAGDLIVLTGQDSYAHIYSDAQGILYGIDPREGSILWEWKMSTAMFGHPVRIGDDLLVQTGDNSVYRISDKGEKLWSFSGPQAGLSMNSGPSPLVDGDVCYTVMTNGDALALRSDNGDLLWRRQLMLDNDAVVLSELKTPLADPVLIGDVLVVSFYQGDLIGLSARDGQQLWQRSLSLKSAPLAHDGRLFAASNDSVLELDPASGATLWKRKLDAGELVGPALAQAKLYVADIRGNVFTLSLDGHVTGELHLPGRVDRSPVVVAGGVLLRNNLGGLYLIR